jgi:hypothetical protein
MSTTRNLRAVAGVMLVAALLIPVDASARGGRGGHGSGHGGHGHGGHGHRGHFHGGVFVGIGGPWWGGPWWYGSPSWYGAPYSYAPASVYPPPPVYIQRSPSYWYYCASAGAYYPNAPTCPEPWIPVPGS